MRSNSSYDFKAHILDPIRKSNSLYDTSFSKRSSEKLISDPSQFFDLFNENTLKKSPSSEKESSVSNDDLSDKSNEKPNIKDDPSNDSNEDLEEDEEKEHGSINAEEIKNDFNDNEENNNEDDEDYVTENDSNSINSEKNEEPHDESHEYQEEILPSNEPKKMFPENEEESKEIVQKEETKEFFLKEDSVNEQSESSSSCLESIREETNESKDLTENDFVTKLKNENEEHKNIEVEIMHSIEENKAEALFWNKNAQKPNVEKQEESISMKEIDKKNGVEIISKFEKEEELVLDDIDLTQENEKIFYLESDEIFKNQDRKNDSLFIEKQSVTIITNILINQDTTNENVRSTERLENKMTSSENMQQTSANPDLNSQIKKKERKSRSARSQQIKKPDQNNR